MEETEIHNLVLSVGTHRKERPYSPIEVANVFVKLGQTNTVKQISELCMIGADMVSRITKLSTLNNDLSHLVDWGTSSNTKIGMSVASEITRLNDESQQILLANLSMKHKITKAEIKHIINFVNPKSTYFRKPIGINEAVKKVIESRPIIKDIFLIMGAITDKQLSGKLNELSSQNDRDKLLTQIISSLYTRDQDWTCSLGSKQFVLSGNDVFGQFISNLSTNLEEHLTKLLMIELE